MNENKLKKKLSKNVVTDDFELGKLKPQDIELEMAVLGSILLENNALTTVIEILSANMFYLEKHQVIYSAIEELFASSEPVDIITVTDYLKKKGMLEFVGGRGYISMLTQRISSTAHVEQYARKVVEKHILRELIENSNNIIKKAYDETVDVFDLLDEAESALFAITETNVRQRELKMSELINRAINEIQKTRNKEGGEITGIPTGFTELDKVTSGWQNSDLIIIAARPGMGKTAFVLTMARNIAVDYKRPVAFFSLEMSATQLVTRLISAECEIESKRLRSGQLEPEEWEKLHQRLGALSQAPIYIDDSPSLSIFELRAKARRLKAKYDINIIIIDYLQLMITGNEKKGTRVEEISTITRALKCLAKELNIPVICLSQLNRSVEVRGGEKKPMLADLRDSGSIEQDADIVAFIYRPEYYKIEKDKEGNPLKGIAEICIEKHRNGNLKDVKLKFIDKYTKFEDLSPSDFNVIETFQTSDDENNFVRKNTYIVPSKMNDDIDLSDN